MSIEVFATHFEVGKYYKVAVIEKRITHIPTGAIMEDENDANWHCAYKGYIGSDFKIEEICRSYLPFKVEAISLWTNDDEDPETVLTSDIDFRNNSNANLEYEIMFACENSVYVDSDYMIASVEITSELEKLAAYEKIKEWYESIDSMPDEPSWI
jgi:hypothetical protein